MRYPQTFIEDCGDKADIVRIIQDYVPLKKKGKTGWRVVRFTKRKRLPSRSFPRRRFFTALAVTRVVRSLTVMDIENVPFPEPSRLWLKRAGRALPKMSDDDRFEQRDRNR